MGQGVNTVTGDYSRGAAGFWVENGAIQYPVAEITIAGNLRDMFKGIAAVGDDIDARGGMRVGSILLQEMTIAGRMRRCARRARPRSSAREPARLLVGDEILERALAELALERAFDSRQHLHRGRHRADRRRGAPLAARGPHR